MQVAVRSCINSVVLGEAAWNDGLMVVENDPPCTYGGVYAVLLLHFGIVEMSSPSPHPHLHSHQRFALPVALGCQPDFGRIFAKTPILGMRQNLFGDRPPRPCASRGEGGNFPHPSPPRGRKHCYGLINKIGNVLVFFLPLLLCCFVCNFVV